MSEVTKQHRRCIIWCEPDQAELARLVCANSNLDLVAIGCIARGKGTAIAAVTNAGNHFADIRQAVLEYEHDLVLLLTMQGITPADVGHVIGKNSIVLTLEPVPDGIADCPRRQEAKNVWLIPLMRRSQAITLFEEISESFSTVRSVCVTMRGCSYQGSLYARLTDAMDVLEQICGQAELLDAAMSTPLGMSAEAPDSLRAMHGHLTINTRFAENCCGCVQVSDVGSTWARGITILGDGGCARLTDRAFEWWNQSGKLVDSARLDDNFENFPDSIVDPLPVRLLSQQINRVLDPSKPRLEQRNILRVVAVCEAVRLSLATGASETPRKLMELIK